MTPASSSIAGSKEAAEKADGPKTAPLPGFVRARKDGEAGPNKKDKKKDDVSMPQQPTGQADSKSQNRRGPQQSKAKLTNAVLEPLCKAYLEMEAQHRQFLFALNPETFLVPATAEIAQMVKAGSKRYQQVLKSVNPKEENMGCPQMWQIMEVCERMTEKIHESQVEDGVDISRGENVSVWEATQIQMSGVEDPSESYEQQVMYFRAAKAFSKKGDPEMMKLISGIVDKKMAE